MSEVKSNSALQLNLESYRAADGKLSLYVNHNQGASFSAGKDAYSVSLGKEELEVIDVQTVGETGVPVTVQCLVDVSGSLDKSRMNVMKETLSCLVENLREGDSVCIIAMGDELRSSGFLTDKEEIQAQIEALEVLHEDTNLYKGIEESLLLLRTDTGASAKRCLLVLSDGAEDNTSGITREEVNAIVQDSHIPVYTVGMIKNSQNQSQLESVKILGSFARLSAGGRHYVPALEDMSAEQIAENIWNSVLEGQVITVDTNGLSPTGRELYLQVSVHADGIGTANTGINVPDGDVITESTVTGEEERPASGESISEEESIAEEEESQVAEETGTLQEEPVRQGANVSLIACIGTGILIIVILAVLVSKKRKKTAKQEPQSEQMQVNVEESEIQDLTAESKELLNQEMPDEDKLLADTTPDCEPVSDNNPQKASLLIQLIRVGISESKSFSLTVTESLTMGRNPELAVFSLPEDKSLSGLHCTFYYRNGSLFLEDNNSTNGTYVNGVPIKGIIRLNRDDILLIGSYEYRICW